MLAIMPQEPTRKPGPILQADSDEEYSRFNLRLPLSVREKLEKESRDSGVSPTELIRRRIEGNSAEKPVESENLRQVLREELAILTQTRPGASVVEIGETSGGVPLHQFDAMPCGPLEESEFGATRMELPAAIAKVLRAKPGDWLIPAKGESMVEAGIADGALVLMRPYSKGKKPLEGDIVLTSIETEDGKRFSTIKFWYSGPRGTTKLLDGKLAPFRMPENVKSLFPMAVFIGIIGPAPGSTGTATGRRASEGGRPGAKRNEFNHWENPESE